jgi:hypothetical protein
MKSLKPIQKEMIRGSWIFSFIPEHERKGKLSDPAVGEQRSETDKRRLCSSTLLQTSEPHRRKLQKFTSKRGTNPEFKRNSASRPSRFPDTESQGAKSTAPQMHREKKTQKRTNPPPGNKRSKSDLYYTTTSQKSKKQKW